MKFKNIVAGLCLSLSFAAFSGEHFSSVGKVDSFRWAPERYENSFRYDIFYYVPQKIKDTKNVGALIFAHGGGASTMDREGSISAVNMYMSDLKRMADELGIVVVLPSANGLNWGSHSRGMMRDLSRMMKQELNIDVNRIGVSGHSMGGMGITRNFIWGADEFAFFLPMAAGMEERHQTEDHLNKVFNVPYVHLQGKKDHFREFVTRCEEQIKRTKDLEVLYGRPSKLDVVFYNGSHNYDFNLFKKHLSTLIKDSPRDLYQKELWGSLLTVKRKIVDNGITFDMDSESRYFWVEAVGSDLSQQEKTDFHAKIEGNTIRIDFKVMPKMTKNLKVYLHSTMVDLDQNIEVIVNGELKASRAPKASALVNMDQNDAGFNFNDVMDIKL